MPSGLFSRLKRVLARSLPETLARPLAVRYYARNLSSMTENDEPDFAVVKYLVAPGDYVVDIGANVGDYTKFLSDLVGPHGKVLAIEPIPRTFGILVACVKFLRLENVAAMNCAISDVDGLLEMEIPEYDEGHDNFYQAHVVEPRLEKQGKRLAVESRRLDGIVEARSKPLSFLKCDVEGHEFKCLQGALNVLDGDGPSCLIELSGNPDDGTSSASQVLELMRNRGYGVYWFDGKSLRKRCVGDRSVNYFFLKEGHLKRVEAGMAVIDSPR